MREFQSTMSKIVKDHKKGKRYLAFLVALSMIVSVAVPFSLIMPAISMTYDDETFQEDDFDNLSEDSDGLTLLPLSNTDIVSMSAENDYPGALEISKNEIDTMYIEDDNGNSLLDPNYGEVTGDSLSLDFELTYKFSDKKNYFNKNTDKRYMYISTEILKGNLTFEHISESESEHPNWVTDEKYATDKEAGTFEFKDGYILIILTDDYIDYLNKDSNDGSIRGSLKFEGELSRGDDADGEKKFTIANKEVTVKFKEQNPTLDKWNTVNSDGTITWTVTINNENGLDLSNYTLDDTMLASAIEEIKFDPEVGTYSSDNNNITFNPGTKDRQVTITYKTNITEEQLRDTEGSRKNTATLKKGDEDVAKKDSTAQFNKKPIDVSKTGKADYQNGKAHNNKIDWEIKVKSVHGTSLQNYTIEDANIPTNINEVKITPPGVSLVSAGAGTWKLDLNGATASEVTIKYQTEADPDPADGKTWNTVKVKYPNGDPVDDEKKASVEYKKKSDLIDLNKNGTYDPDTHEITWTITVTPKDNFSLNGYELYDSKFKADGEISVKRWDWEINDKVLLSDGKLVFKDDCNITNGDVTITYKEKIENLPEADQQVSNDVEDSNGKKSNYSVTVNGKRNDLSKTLTNGSKTESIPNSGVITKTLKWQAKITSDDSLAGKKYTDTLKVDKTTDATHELNKDSIVVKAKKTQYGQEDTLKEGKDYTVSQNGNTFEITFANDIDPAYNYVTIDYNTTATAKKPTNSDFTEIEYNFSNEGGFNGKTSGDGFGLTRTNPNKTVTMDLGVNKAWDDNNNSANERPNNVYFKLKYRIGSNGDWKDVKKSGNDYLFDGDTGYKNAGNHIISLDSNGNWSTNLTGLPKEITKANTDGSQGATAYYFYKLEEVDASGNPINHIKTTNGIYEVGNSNTLGAAGDLSIKNTYYKKVNITATKNWDDNNYTTNRRPITVELWQYTDAAANNGTWRTNHEVIGGTKELNAGNGWTIANAWENLPTKDVDANGNIITYYYRLVETKFDGKAIDDSKLVIFGDDGYYECNTESSAGSGNNFDGNLTVTNTFHKTESLTIGMEKSWSDADHTDNRPKSIIVALQKKADNVETWETVDTQTLEVTGDKQNYTWSDGLVSQSVKDGKAIKYTYRVVEIGYVYDGKTYTFDEKQWGKNPEFATKADEGSYEGTYKIGYNASNELRENGTVEITNTFTPLGSIAITPQKKWIGSKNSEVKFRLKQRLGNGEWKDAKNASGNVIEVELKSDSVTEDEETNWEWNGTLNQMVEVSNSTWTGTEISDLPKQKITINTDGTIKKQNYSYRFVEVVDGKELADGDSFKTTGGNYVVTLQAAVNSTGNFVVTNTFKESVGALKSAVDKDAKKITSIDMDDLKDYKYTFEGKDYYIFNWLIELETDKQELVTPILDKLPEGFTLVEDNRTLDWSNDSYYSADEQQIKWGDGTVTAPFKGEIYENANKKPFYLSPCIIYVNLGSSYIKRVPMVYDDAINDNDVNPDNKNNVARSARGAWNLPGTSPARYYYDKTKNQIYFGIPALTIVPVFTYSTKIECDKLEAELENGSFTITNNVEMYDNDGNPTDRNTSASLTIVNKAPSNLITKDYKSQGIPGYIGFSLDVNPDGKNLSNGDTIDIEDIFKTDSYLDKDKNNQLTSGENLVDVLMNNIRLYKVDVNGNKTPLDKSEYTLKFESKESGVKNQDDETGAALLKLTIPDETHIVIDYVYKLIANNKTPSVKNGCKSSTRVQGKYPVMAPGMVPPAGDEITFTNHAKLYSDSASADDSVKKQEYKISKSSGTISTNTLPKVKKVDVGNYGINLTAKFLLARYDQSQQKWFYAQEITPGNEITKWTDGVTGLTVANDAVKIDVDTGYSYQLSLSKDSLYKLVEVEVPEGYEGSNLGLSNDDFEKLIKNYLNNQSNTILNGTDYATFLKNYVSVYYFVYNSVMTSYPDGITSDQVLQVKSGEDIEIPNNQLIDIDVTKNWHNETKGGDVQVKLYWSYTKSSTGMPSNAKVATAADLGLMAANFKAVQTVKTGEKNKGVWTDLPNGKNGKPIYYYVKEISYTLGNEVYTLDETSRTYKSEKDKDGGYYPTYVGNAANTDSNITITNSKQLMLKKLWKNASNNPLSENKIPVDEITVDIYGITADGIETKLFEEGIILKKENGWQLDITDELKEIDLSKYKSFRADESNSSGFDTDDYVVSCVFNLNNDTGEITVTNKSKVATEASVTVNKVWSDGEAMHKGDTIKVTLYQSESEIKNVANMTQDDLQDALQNATIMTKISDEDTQNYQDVELNAANNWTYTWTGLPIDDGAEDSTVSYYYYVLEDMSDVANNDKYTATYTPIKSGAKTTYTVKNTRTAIVVQKQWFDENGEPIIDIYDEDGNLVTNNTSSLPSIELRVYKQNSVKPANGLKLIAFGDSITDGYASDDLNCSRNGKDYPSKLVSSLEKNGYTIVGSENVNNNINKGHSGQQIGDSASASNTIRSQVTSDISSDANVICFLGGTNDIHQSYSPVQGNSDGVFERFKACIKEIKKQAPDAVIFVGSIPHFNFYKEDGSLTIGGEWWDNTEYTKDNGKLGNAAIDAYNLKIKAYAGSTDNVYFVDVCSVVTPDCIRADGCHPNEAGYTAIANAYYNAINEYYTEKDYLDGTVSLNFGNNWTAVVDVPDDGEYYIEEVNVPDGWEVTYSGQGLKPGTVTPVIAMNKKQPTPKTEISVEKTWVGDSADTTKRDGISLALMCSTNNTDWEEVAVDMPTPTKNGNTWTYVYTGLPVTDNAGRTYYYKVEEAKLDGYKATYGTPNSLKALETNTGTLEITNTRLLSLKLKKDWAGESDKQGSVSVNIYRSTNKQDVPKNEELILQVVPSTVSVGVNEYITVKANKTITTAKSNAETTASVSEPNGQEITIYGKEKGTAEITVTDEKGNTETIRVIVSTLEMFLNNVKTFTLVAGTDGTLSAKLNGENTTVTFSSNDESVLSISGSEVSANAPGKAIVTAIYEDDEMSISIEQEIEVTLPEIFNITGGKEVAINGNLQLGVDTEFGTFKWSSSDESIATVNDNGVVTGVKAGKVTITATRNDGNTATHNVTVMYGDIFESYDALTLMVRIGDTITLPASKGINGIYDYNQSIIQASSKEENGKTYLVITGLTIGETTCNVQDKINYQGKLVTVKVIDKFTVSPATKTLAYGQSVILTPNMDDHIQYTIKSGKDIISIDENEVTANYKDGTAVIVAKNLTTNETAEVIINVVAELNSIEQEFSTEGEIIFNKNRSVSAVTLELNPNNASSWPYVTLKFGDDDYVKVGYPGNAKLDFDLNGYYKLTNISTTFNDDNKSVTIKFNDNWQPDKIAITSVEQNATGKVIVEYDSPTPTFLSLRNVTTNYALSDTMLLADGTELKGELVDTVDITATTGWQTVVEDLDVYDPVSKLPYYYWVVEDTTSSAGYDVSYLFEDDDDNTNYSINAANPGDGAITIRNTKIESHEISMPSTGGPGVGRSHTVGIILMCGSTASYILARRRRNRRKRA